jgi:hypothetical protein
VKLKDKKSFRLYSAGPSLEEIIEWRKEAIISIKKFMNSIISDISEIFKKLLDLTRKSLKKQRELWNEQITNYKKHIKILE